jgi:hypothetical protein
MIRAAKPDEPAPLPKAKPRIRKPKTQKKGRDIGREITDGIAEAAKPVDPEAGPST